MKVPPALVRRLTEAQHVAVLTGSGISAESGVPTFRDAQTGLWARFSPEELATPEAFDRDPAFVWRWYNWRRGLVMKAMPNAGHLALTQLAARLRRLTLITQNVDGLHQRAGSPGVIEFHGNILRERCSRGCPGHREATIDEKAQQPPRCEACDAPMRPDVVWFGEVIPQETLAEAHSAVADCDVFFSIGTSSLVFPAAALVEGAREVGAAIVEVNPNETPLSAAADFVLRAPAGTVLPALVAALRN